MLFSDSTFTFRTSAYQQHHIKKAKKMAFQGRPYIKISSKNKSVYALSATGYHFTGPIALRPWISPSLRIKFCKYYKAIILFRIKNKE